MVWVINRDYLSMSVSNSAIVENKVQLVCVNHDGKGS